MSRLATASRKRTRAAPYRYLRIRPHLFVSADYNPIALSWFLSAKARPFLSPGGRLARTPRLRRVLVAARLLFQNLKQRLRPREDDEAVVHLSVSGHLAVRRLLASYKIFDIERGVVRTCFDDTLPARVIEKQITAAQTVAQCPRAPGFIRGNIAERWFEETYINGHPYPRLRPWEAIPPEVLDLLGDIVTALPPRTLLLRDYLDDCAASIASLWRRLSNPAYGLRLQSLAARVERVLAELHTAGPRHVALTLSHGDFVAKNILRCHERLLCVVDWEQADYRSALYDLQYLAYERFVSSGTHTPRLLQMAAATVARESTALRAHLDRHYPELSSTFFPTPCSPGFHRWLFLIEQLVMEERHLERRPSLPAVIIGAERWISIFEALQAA